MLGSHWLSSGVRHVKADRTSVGRYSCTRFRKRVDPDAYRRHQHHQQHAAFEMRLRRIGAGRDAVRSEHQLRDWIAVRFGSDLTCEYRVQDRPVQPLRTSLSISTFMARQVHAQCAPQHRTQFGRS